MGKRLNMVLDDDNEEDLRTIKKNIGVVNASQAVRWALRFAAEHFKTHPSAIAPQERPAQPKALTRSAPKPGGEPRYVKDEE